MLFPDIILSIRLTFSLLLLVLCEIIFQTDICKNRLRTSKGENMEQKSCIMT